MANDNADTRLSADLPVWRSVVLGYAETWRYLAPLMLIAALWALIVDGGAAVILDLTDNTSVGDPATPTLFSSWRLIGFVAWLLQAIGGVIIAVASYRAVLMGERPSPLLLLHFRRRELRALGVDLVYRVLNLFEILLLQVILGATFGATVLAGLGNSLLADFSFNMAQGIISDLTIAPFMILAYPLAAIEARTSLFGTAWRLGRGLRLRICAVSFLAGLPFMVISHLPALLFDQPTSTLEVYGYEVVVGFLGLMWMAFYSGCIALAFDWIGQRRQQEMVRVFD